MTRPIVTRFAPSPTGYLHIGGARTALFNWLYAKANGGKFLLRIEDTDRERSTQAATDALLHGLNWLGLDWDGEAISQHANADRHRAVAQQLLETGAAYKCFSTPEEIEAFRAASDGFAQFQSPWRDADPSSYPDAPYAIRLKTPHNEQITIDDQVQGTVTFKTDEFDDLILLRSDGTPTYMLAVVVDDYDMGVTHIIRGDDHLINAGRQSLIYQAMGWEIPVFAHIPLIHGEDGKKLSKRHGATGVHEYAALGYRPEAMRNYLCRLGWSHGNDEVFSTQQAIEWFDFKGMGKAPARLDFKKLDHVSAQHIKNGDPVEVAQDLWRFADEIDFSLTDAQKTAIASNLPAFTERAKRLGDIFEAAHVLFVTTETLDYDEKAEKQLNSVSIGILNQLTPMLQTASWNETDLLDCAKAFASENDLGLGKIGMPLKAALSGRAAGPSAFLMMALLGLDESLARIKKAADTFE